jgi:hypothetical protein
MPDAANVTDKVFDQIAHRLRRNPRFAGMSINEIDLVLADARREFEVELDRAFDSVERRLVQSFRDEIGFGETEGEAA